jgi:signal transduction histidine kinase
MDSTDSMKRAEMPGELPPETLGRRWDWIGCAAGLLLGLADWAFSRTVGIEVTLGARDVAPATFALFGATYALLGWAIGRLAMARARLREDAGIIERQLRELERTQRELVQQEKLAAIGRLAAGIAHEVRNPLGVIRASAAMLREDFEPGEEAHRACDFITEEIDRLNALIESLLDFARPAQPRPSLVGIDRLCERAFDLSAETLGERRISISMELEPGLKALRADPDLISQVLYGLILNASQAVDEGGHIAARARRASDAVELELADDGPGVGEPDVDKIFEPFYTTKATGTGLGLPMALRIVEMHGGELHYVRDRGLGTDGRGACFRVRLPLEEAA